MSVQAVTELHPAEARRHHRHPGLEEPPMMTRHRPKGEYIWLTEARRDALVEALSA